MNDSDKQIYRDRYVRRLAEFGHDPKTLGWTAGKQYERFEVLLSACPLTQVESVLDVGCGFGDLFHYLKAKGFEGTYQGIDIVPELVEQGRATSPGIDLVVTDLFNYKPDRTWDVVIASGVFNARLLHEDQWTHVSGSLKKMYDLSRIVAAADFLTSYADFNRDDLCYSSPEEVFRFAKSLTRRVALLHNYMPFEFCIQIFKDDRIAEGSRFYPLGS